MPYFHEACEMDKLLRFRYSKEILAIAFKLRNNSPYFVPTGLIIVRGLSEFDKDIISIRSIENLKIFITGIY